VARKRAKPPTRVVIGEDEAIIRLDLKELLEEEGYEVVGELRDYIVPGHAEWLLRKTTGPLS